MATEVKLSGDALELPGGVRVTFVRTLRLPETGTYPLPPGLGTFPLRRVADYPDTVPAQWRERGGVMLPIYQREALWLKFTATTPAALKVAVGKVCAVSGKPWSDVLGQDPQNYLALPRQPWLDGINSGDGSVRQFVAVPMGLGATVEGQVTGTEQWGGVQLAVHGLTDIAREAWVNEQALHRPAPSDEGAPWLTAPYGAPMTPGAPMPVSPAAYGGAPSGPAPAPAAPPALGARPAGGDMRRRGSRAMGMGAGGTMRQEIYADRRPLEDYHRAADARIFVHLASAAEWQDITGEPAPSTPVTAQSYTQHGLPWFDYYAADAEDLAPATELAGVKPTGHWLADEHPNPPIEGDLPVISLGDKTVQDGNW
ncbi:hypothetical protein [Nocardia caishijiensis]|uniref:Integral membrane protein n=1 Tax=Nocardia caishijiensis TaxID=184756 RepID=A0ABQ6YML6_9NOCA|nr:hypothetical protein [Nocardia caishijiensis]KAF0846951.1 hypothetical protein FNL39_104373 [Nocardia caishijiensis]